MANGISTSEPTRSRIRVLLTIGSLHGGGSERQIVSVLNHLDRSRFEPFLYLVYKQGELLDLVPSDVKVLACDPGQLGGRVYLPGRIHRAVVRDLNRVIREHNIDVVYDRTFHMTLIAAAAVRRERTKRISVIVSDPRRDFEQTAGRFRFLKYHLLRRDYRTADRVVAVSEHVRQNAIDYYRLNADRVITLPNGIDLDHIDRQVDAVHRARSPFDKSEGRFHIVTAGRLSDEKGHAHLIEAIRLLVQKRNHKSVTLHVLGSGPLETQFREFVAAHALDGFVRLHGFQPNPIDWYSSADLFCLPSLYEGMPNALLEAMACRVPVLATDCPSGLAGLLDHGRLGRLVPPGDPASLANAIEHIQSNNDESHQKIPFARQRVEERHALKTAMEQLHELIESIHTSL